LWPADALEIAPVIEAAVKDFGWHPQFAREEKMAVP
jgi:hypothetical protein